jgi:hypothetical protein
VLLDRPVDQHTRRVIHLIQWAAKRERSIGRSIERRQFVFPFDRAPPGRPDVLGLRGGFAPMLRQDYPGWDVVARATLSRGKDPREPRMTLRCCATASTPCR